MELYLCYSIRLMASCLVKAKTGYVLLVAVAIRSLCSEGGTDNCLSWIQRTGFKSVRKIAKRLVALSCLSVCLHGTTELPLDGFS